MLDRVARLTVKWKSVSDGRGCLPPPDPRYETIVIPRAFVLLDALSPLLKIVLGASPDIASISA